MALEVVGGAFLSSFLNVLFERLASREFMDLLREKELIMGLLEKLKITLWSANKLLNDTEDKQITDSEVKHWIDMLNEVLHDADTVVDKINTEALRRKIEGSSQSRCNLGRILKKVIPTSIGALDTVIKLEIENVLQRLKFILDQKDCLGLREGVQSKRLDRLPAPLIADPSDVFGRDSDKETIIRLILSNNVIRGEKITVIPIVGMGGIGKTTLARLVYKDTRVKNYFDIQTWVTVSDDFDILRLAKAVYKGLTSKECDVEELDKLHDELENATSGKKFFLVLDDVWNEDYNRWTVLKSCLQVGANGSKIIVTTRSEIVASKMGSVPFYLVSPVSDEDCWQLFQKHAFLHNVEQFVYQDLEEVGKKIVKKCKGLPLAVKALAGLLRSVTNLNEWEKILKSDVWDLQSRGNNTILPSLWLSYSYLPSHLKRCFAYCSIFPKDYEYDKKQITLLWMADGLLRGENMEDMGEEYFQSLISRSLFQRSSKDESSVVMHDLVHDLALFVSGKDFSIVLGTDDHLHNLGRKTRHLLYEEKLLATKNFDGMSEAKCVKNWVDMLNEVLHDADTVVDKINTEALGRKIEGSSQSRCNLGRILKKVIPTSIGALDTVIKPEIETVLERLKLILDQKDCLGLSEGVQSKRLERLPAPPITDPSDVYGRDSEKQAIIQLIVSNNVIGGEKITVIPIVGMGGIGKSTLARLVYNDRRVKNYFVLQTWVTVSDDFDILRLAKAVFKGLTSQECDVEELDQLQVKMEAALTRKKFFLVLDDVWKEDYNRWTVLKSCLQVGANGSKIIVTTRSEIVASNMGNVPFHLVRVAG